LVQAGLIKASGGGDLSVCPNGGDTNRTIKEFAYWIGGGSLHCKLGEVVDNDEGHVFKVQRCHAAYFWCAYHDGNQFGGSDSHYDIGVQIAGAAATWGEFGCLCGVDINNIGGEFGGSSTNQKWVVTPSVASDTTPDWSAGISNPNTVRFDNSQALKQSCREAGRVGLDVPASPNWIIQNVSQGATWQIRSTLGGQGLNYSC